MTKRAIKTRRAKLEEAIVKPPTKEKFLEKAREEDSVLKFQPKTPKQKTAMAMLREGRSVVFLTGSAGTGKSMVAAAFISEQMAQKKVDKVYLVRPAVSTGKSVGLLPGTLEEKLAPYFAQTIAHLEKFMGVGPVGYHLRSKGIELQAVEYLRGRSFENCIVLCEEAQNFTAEQMEMLVTRLGDNCTLIFTGDTKQNDLHMISGLADILKRIDNVCVEQPIYMENEDLDAFEDLIGVVEFLPEDVVRSGLTKAFVRMYYHAK